MGDDDDFMSLLDSYTGGGGEHESKSVEKEKKKKKKKKKSKRTHKSRRKGKKKNENEKENTDKKEKEKEEEPEQKLIVPDSKRPKKKQRPTTTTATADTEPSDPAIPSTIGEPVKKSNGQKQKEERETAKEVLRAFRMKRREEHEADQAEKVQRELDEKERNRQIAERMKTLLSLDSISMMRDMKPGPLIAHLEKMKTVDLVYLLIHQTFKENFVFTEIVKHWDAGPLAMGNQKSDDIRALLHSIWWDPPKLVCNSTSLSIVVLDNRSLPIPFRALPRIAQVCLTILLDRSSDHNGDPLASGARTSDDDDDLTFTDVKSDEAHITMKYDDFLHNALIDRILPRWEITYVYVRETIILDEGRHISISNAVEDLLEKIDQRRRDRSGRLEARLQQSEHQLRELRSFFARPDFDIALLDQHQPSSLAVTV